MITIDDVKLRRGPFTLQATTQIAQGERIALMGASGSGKSTLLSLLAGFDEPDAGSIMVGGRSMAGVRPADRPISILFQDSNLFPHLSVFENVAVGLRTNLRLSDDDRAQVDHCLHQTGLSGMGDRLPRDLSGGQQSRVALARVLLRDKPIVLLDEPFAALDPGLRRDMLDVFDDMCRAKQLTVVMVTHEFRDAERLCQKLLLLEEGGIILEGEISTLKASAPAPLQPWL